jgi:hypothetical protein
MSARTAGWVGLYRDAAGRLLLQRDGSPFAYVVGEESSLVHAWELAQGEFDRWEGEILIRAHPSDDQWPGGVGRLIAVWEDGRVWKRTAGA